MIRVLIADDHTLFREGLKKIIAGTSDIAVAGEASNGNDVLARLKKDSFDVLVLDISMPGKDGLEVLKEVRTKYQRLPVLMLSMFPEEQYATRVLKAGASGYLTKESAPDVLITAVRKAARGERYVSPTLAEKLVSGLADDLKKLPHERLSDREYQIMRLIASGKRMKEIAHQLSLGPTTISTYRARILEKMGMASNAELTLYASQNNLLH
ncbi:MAG: response regulator transcription factor [Syntrophorhabdales bacterium]|jgi:DNA-binding NarL/FixJ family response regulator